MPHLKLVQEIGNGGGGARKATAVIHSDLWQSLQLCLMAIKQKCRAYAMNKCAAFLMADLLGFSAAREHTLWNTGTLCG